MSPKTPDARQLRLALRKDYALGKKIAATFPQRLPYGEATEIGARFGRPDLTRDKAEKLRKLAIAYSIEEFRALLSKCKAAAYLPGITLLTRLATLPTRRMRRSVEAKMIAGRWTKRELNLEILSRVGRRRSGGRKRRVPLDPTALLTTLEKQCHAWLGWSEQLRREATMNKPLKTRLEGAEKEIQRLRSEVAKQISASRKTSKASARRNKGGTLKPAAASRSARPKPSQR